MIVAGAANIMKQLLEGSGVRLAEPIMRLEVMTNQELVGTVVQDMVQRRGNVLGTAGMSEVMHINLFSLTTHLLTADNTELCGDGRCSPGGAGRVQQGPEDHHQRPGRHQHAAQPLSGELLTYFWVIILWLV